jgi:hypothetical protein
MESWIDLVVAAMLAILGAALARYELRLRPAIEVAEDSERSYLRRRLKRRMRVAILLGLLAVAIFAARLIEGRSIPYLLIWFVVLFLALRLLWLGIVDYLEARLHWVGQTQRNLVDIARTRAELRDLQSRRRSSRNGDG